MLINILLRSFKSGLSLLMMSSFLLLISCETTDTWQKDVPLIDSTNISILSQINMGGFHSCSVTASGNVKCWGFGGDGQLGNGQTVDQNHPVLVVDENNTPLSDIIQVSAGGRHSCAVSSSGNVKCWGKGINGQLGNNEMLNNNHPVLVMDGEESDTPLSDIVQVSVGNEHTCVLTGSGNVKCWGMGANGQLGNNQIINKNHPVFVMDGKGSKIPLADIVQISMGYNHACAVTDSGNVKCWGSRKDSIPYPVLVMNGKENKTPLSKIVQISSGLFHNCALTRSGTVKCWGEKNELEVGYRAGNISYPSLIRDKKGNPLKGIAQVDVGDLHSCLLTNLGNVKCWGLRVFLGNGHKEDAHPDERHPVFVMDESNTLLEGIIQINAGSTHNCALAGSGNMKCWGNGSYGRLGYDDKNESKLHPVSVMSGSDFPFNPGLRLTSYSCRHGKCSLNLSSQLALSLTITSPWHDTTPTIDVYRLKQGDMVSLHSDKNCVKDPLVEDTVAEDFKMDLTVSELGENGDYTFYLKKNSICLPLGIKYTLDSSIKGRFIYVATEEGLSISNDSGANWMNKTTSDGLGGSFVYDVTAIGEIIYAATSGGVSLSTDGGHTWVNKTTSDGLGSNVVNAVDASSKIICAATDGGLSLSTDGGMSWVNKTTLDGGLGDNTVHDVIIDEGIIYAGTDGGFSMSIDQGETWSNHLPNSNENYNQIYGVFVNKQTWYSAGFSGLFISSDSIQTWSLYNLFNGLLSSPYSKVFADGQSIYVSSQRGLSISTDGGENWITKTASDGLGHNSLDRVYAFGETIYVSTFRGLSISTDGGETWITKTTSDGLIHDNIKGVFIQ